VYRDRQYSCFYSRKHQGREDVIDIVNAKHEHERLAAAITAVRHGNKTDARRLIISVLKDDPHNELAWSWACEVAATPEERIHCLQQILAINPNHAAARRYLAQLQTSQSAVTPHPPVTEKTPLSEDRAHNQRVADLLLAPLGCLLQASATHLTIALLALALIGGILYYTANIDFLGLAGPDFEDLTISGSKEQIKADDVYWKITYEKLKDSQFSGLVRHVSPIRDNRMRILTHDILVTSGEFADPAIVSTSVANHHFTWRSASTAHPKGTINLLHTVPADEDIYRQLLKIRPQDEVTITGREILSIEVFDQAGNHLGEWHDTGCNTLLVNSVTILQD
jgi:hypothetical protein